MRTVHYPTLEEGEFKQHLLAFLAPEIELTVGPGNAVAMAEALVSGRPDAALLDSLPNLKALIIPWSGLPRTTRELLLKHPQLAVHNLHHNAAPVAEHTMALLLSVARHLLIADRALREGDWTLRYDSPRSPLLAGSRVLILGAGAVGSRLARACEGLDMLPTLVARRPRGQVRGIEELDDLLPEAQVLLMALPETPETEGLLDARRLALLPEGAILVNVGRASAVCEEALFGALKERHLLGAGLDVWYAYPGSEEERADTAPSNFPFHELDNVVMSPHRAGHGIATAELRARALADLLNAAARGEPMPNPIDPARGY